MLGSFTSFICWDYLLILCCTYIVRPIAYIDFNLALAKEYSNMSSAKLLHERLLATGMLDKPYERLASDIKTLIDAPDIADLLVDKPNITNTVIAFNKTNNEQLNSLLGELISDNARANGEGNAIKINGEYAENGDLSSLNNIDGLAH